MTTVQMSPTSSHLPLSSHTQKSGLVFYIEEQTFYLELDKSTMLLVGKFLRDHGLLTNKKLREMFRFLKDKNDFDDTVKVHALEQKPKIASQPRRPLKNKMTIGDYDLTDRPPSAHRYATFGDASVDNYGKNFSGSQVAQRVIGTEAEKPDTDTFSKADGSPKSPPASSERCVQDARPTSGSEHDYAEVQEESDYVNIDTSNPEQKEKSATYENLTETDDGDTESVNEESDNNDYVNVFEQLKEEKAEPDATKPHTGKARAKERHPRRQHGDHLKDDTGDVASPQKPVTMRKRPGQKGDRSFLQQLLLYRNSIVFVDTININGSVQQLNVEEVGAMGLEGSKIYINMPSSESSSSSQNSTDVSPTSSDGGD